MAKGMSFPQVAKAMSTNGEETSWLTWDGVSQQTHHHSGYRGKTYSFSDVS
jgi:hypothetical protein